MIGAKNTALKKQVLNEYNIIMYVIFTRTVVQIRIGNETRGFDLA